MDTKPTSPQELIDAIRPLIDAMPQPDAVRRVAAFFQATATAAGLDQESATGAAAIFLTTLHQAYAEIRVHGRDGSVRSFAERDFPFDVRPGSPYYTDE